MIDAAELIDQIKNSTDTFQKHQCRHTLPEGRRCGSPAMRGEKYCYYHHETRKPVADPQCRQARRNCFHIAPPRTRAAIQESIGEIITRLAYNEIDPRRAGLLLYALQIATTNIKDHQTTQQPTANDSTPKQSPVESNDPSQDPFDAEVFPRTPITPETTAALYEALTHNHTPEPQPVSSEDRQPESRSVSEILPALQAAETPKSQTSSLSGKVSSRLDHGQSQPVDGEVERLASPPGNLAQPTIPPSIQISPRCLQFVISSHKVLPSEHLGSFHYDRGI